VKPHAAVRVARRLLLCTAVLWLYASGLRPGLLQTPSGFADRIAQLSEPGGYFDTDNLISNEKSYLHVIPALREARLTGGAYIGVGPDQNFSYIARVKPAIAFIVDIRRDNLLLHLLFKALFQISTTRVEYLSSLVGRPPPRDLENWRRAGVERLAARVENAKSSPASVTALRARLDAVIRGFGVPLSTADFATIERFHRRFIEQGLDLKFETTGRAPRSYYPSYRDLLLETDRQGHRWNFLASEDDFQFVRSLERRDLIVPVVGNLAGPSAMAAVGRMMAMRGDRLSAFYTSNVEFYLFGDESFSKFIDNVTRLPHSERSLIIRSIFADPNTGLPADTLPGYGSASVVQPVDELLQGYAAGRFHEYRDLTTGR
jgi:hypothetical protein